MVTIPTSEPRQRPRAEPSRDDNATVVCPLCARAFIAAGRAIYCSETCRKKAWRRRNGAAPVPVVVPPPGRPRRPITVYECATCGTRALGVQRCEDCGTFMARVGIGGLCPHCDEAVALCDLIGPDNLAVPEAQQRARTGRRRT